MRLDKALVERGLCKTRSQAKVLIEAGHVFVNERATTKTSTKINEDDDVLLKQEELYVSRGAYKLKHALEYFAVEVEGKTAADIGASTGGFTEVLLKNGARKVYCIDVGHDQLNPSLREDSRVINMENTNIRDVESLPESVDLFVCDVSFISLKLIFKNMDDLLKDSGTGVFLIKPQFEAGKGRIGKNGLVSDQVREEVLNEMKLWFEENNFYIQNLIPSPIVGNKSGNTEYLAYYIKGQSRSES